MSILPGLGRGIVLALLLGGLVVVGNVSSLNTFAQGTVVTLVYDHFVPQVIRFDRTEPVRYEVKVLGRPSRVVLQLDASGQDLIMQDNGSNGDDVAGDNVYTTHVPAQAITGQLQQDDVYRPFVGFVALFVGSNSVFRGNVFAEVITSAILPVTLTQLGPNAQASDYVVNLVDPNLARSLENGTLFIPSERFYQIFPDDYDFLNIISSLSLFKNRFHVVVKNDVFGTGKSAFDNTANYHSNGRLMGITVFPKTLFFDGADEGYQHELAHQWVMYVNAPAIGQGVPHWPLSSMASGIMGWSSPVSGEGLQFPCTLEPEGEQVRLVPRTEPLSFNDMDLYLMGLLPPAAVATQLVFADQNWDRILSQCDGRVYEGLLLPVSVQDIIRAAGPRFPSAQNAPKRFKVATIVVSPKALLDADAMALYSFFAQRAELQQQVAVHQGFFKGTANPFFLSTRGLGSLDACLRTVC